MSLKKLLLFFCFLSIIASKSNEEILEVEELKEITINTGTESPKQEYGTETKLYYKITYNSTLLDSAKQYARIFITPTNLNNTLTAFVSLTDEYVTRENAGLISSYNFPESTVYVPTSAIRQNQGVIYVGITCKISCIFDMRFSFHQTIELTKNVPFTIKTYGRFNRFTASLDLNADYEDTYNFACIGGSEGDGDLLANYEHGESLDHLEHPEGILFNGEIGTFKSAAEPGRLTLECSGEDETVITFMVRQLIPEGLNIFPDERAYYGYLDGDLATQECFFISDSSLQVEEERNYTVTVTTRTGNLIYYMNYPEESQKKIVETKVNGSRTFFIRGNDINNTICLKRDLTSGPVAYSIQLNHLTKEPVNPEPSVEPQVNGLLYTHYLTRGQLKYYRHFKHRNETTEETNFNVREEQGFVETYIVKCTSWPECHYTHEQLEAGGEGIFKTKDVNGFHTFGLKGQNETGLLNSTQMLIFVFCQGGIGCIFTTSFFDEDEDFILPENYEIVQVMNKKQKDHYVFTVTDEKYEKLIIKLHTFTGDSNLVFTKDKQNITQGLNQYWVGNSEIVEITRKEGELRGTYQVSVEADEGNFYSLRYDLIPPGEVTVENLLGGFTYIEMMKANQNETTKKYRIEDRYLEYNADFIVNIIPVNCHIKVKYKDKYIETNDTYYQHHPHIFSHKLGDEEEDPESVYYPYTIEFDSWEQTSNFEEQLCTYYIASSSIYSGTELVLNEGLPFEFKLSLMLRKIRFLYPRPPDGEDVFADIKIEHRTSLNVTIYVENKRFGAVNNIGRDRTFKLLSKTIDMESGMYCKKGQLCNIIFDISMEERNETREGSNIYFIVKSRAKVPSLIKKEKQFEDIIPNSGTNYYIFDITPGESGEVSLNFNRGSGYLLGRIVAKDEHDDDFNWNGKIRLPDKTDYLYDERKKRLLDTYDPFTKTLYYNETHTSSKCSAGCEMYVAVVSDEEYNDAKTVYINDYLFFVKHKENKTTAPTVVDVPTGDFVYGALEQDLSKDYYDYYTVTLMNDNDYLYVELQSTFAELYLNKDDTLPKKDQCWKTLQNLGSDKVMKIPKSEFGVSTFVGLTLKIGIAAQKLDQIYTAPYNFRVYIPIKYSDSTGTVPDLIDVPTDQSSICEISNTSIPCYYVIPKYGDDIAKYVTMYASSSNIAKITLYASKVNMYKFDKLTASQILECLPTQNKSEQSSAEQIDGNHLKYLVSDVGSDDYLIVAVYSTKITQINFIYTFRNEISKTTINPSSWQVFEIDPSEKVTLVLPIEHEFIVNIVAIDGLAEVAYNARTQTIKGAKDTFSTVVRANKSSTLNRNLVLSTDFTFFIFYVNIVVRPQKENFDQVENYINGQYFFPENDFPLTFFTPLAAPDSDYLMNFHIWDALKNYEYRKGIPEGLKIEGTIDTIGNVIARKNDPTQSLNPFNITGVYDDLSNSGRILFRYEEIAKITNPCLIVRIKKAEKNTIQYLKLDLEVFFAPLSNPEYPIPHSLYINSFIPKEHKDVKYLMRKADKDFGNMLIEFAANTNRINFALMEELPVGGSNTEYKNSSLAKEIVTGSGKNFIRIGLKSYDAFYLVVFSKESGGVPKDETKTGFTFRYRSARTFSIKDLSPPDNPIKVVSNKPYKIQVKSIKSGTNYYPYAKYYIAIINSEELKKKGYYQKTIALMDLKLDFPVAEKEVFNKSTFDVELAYYKEKTYYNALILAEIKETGERIIYPIYQLKKKSVVGIALGGTFGGIAAIAIIVLIVYFCKKNGGFKRQSEGNLKNLVEQTSFAQSSKINQDYLTGFKGNLNEIALN